MALLEKQFSAFFNSSQENGSVKIGTMGNEFQVQLQSPVLIPLGCIYATLEVVSAKVWNTSPNISEEIGNNHLYFSYKGIDYDVVFEDGLWGSKEIDMWLGYTFLRNDLPNKLFELTENDATQKYSVKINYKGVTIDFTKPNSCIDVLGFYTIHDKINDKFISDVILTSSLDGESFVAPNEARLNRVVNYYIRSNLVSDGIPVNNQSSGIIAEVPIINARVGSLINYIPTNPLRCDCSDLIGQSKQSITFVLVDQLGRNVSTSNEDFSLAIIIRYYSFEKNKDSYI